MKKFLFWFPRLFAILLAAFISIFAFDVFEENASASTIALGLLTHLIPTFVLVAILIVAWKREQIGGWLFIILGVAFVFVSRFEPYAILLITVPLVLVGAMFLVHHRRYGNATSTVTPSGSHLA